MYEYLSDLENYYRNSYGNGKINEKLPCLLVGDMLKNLANIDNLPAVTVYFSHSSVLVTLLTSLGVFNDTKSLRYDNYAEQNDRQFRSSEITPFASNVAAIRYQCADNSDKVLFLLNQKLLTMKWCKDGALCTLAEIQDMYSNSSMRDCRPNDFCRLNGENGGDDNLMKMVVERFEKKYCSRGACVNSGSSGIVFPIGTIFFCVSWISIIMLFWK